MAARSSCTHLTWSEAKTRAGEGSGGGGKKKAGPKMSHDQILCEKIIKKAGYSKEKDKIADRQAARVARKEMEYIQKVENKRKEEKERKLLEQIVKPYEQARDQMKESAQQRQHEANIPTISVHDFDLQEELKVEELRVIVECKRTQLDELLALEAIYMDQDIFLISEACQVGELREKMEELNEGEETALRSIAQYPPISFSLQLIIHDPNGGDLEACLLLNVEYPLVYPERDTTPIFEVIYCMVTDMTKVCSANKPLKSSGYFQKPQLLDAMKSEAQTILPYPCVYEVVATWLPEHLFSDFIDFNIRQ
jgi:hypothetical protein